VSENNVAATVPLKYRFQEQEAKTTVGTMQVGSKGFVGYESVQIDANWGVWIDSKAEIKRGTDPFQAVAPNGTCLVFRHATGYDVTLLALLGHDPRKFKKVIHTSLNGAGFVPASNVL
jgi:hypothetical protein